MTYVHDRRVKQYSLILKNVQKYKFGLKPIYPKFPKGIQETKKWENEEMSSLVGLVLFQALGKCLFIGKIVGFLPK